MYRCRVLVSTKSSLRKCLDAVGYIDSSILNPLWSQGRRRGPQSHYIEFNDLAIELFVRYMDDFPVERWEKSTPQLLEGRLSLCCLRRLRWRLWNLVGSYILKSYFRKICKSISDIAGKAFESSQGKGKWSLNKKTCETCQAHINRREVTRQNKRRGIPI